MTVVLIANCLLSVKNDAITSGRFSTKIVTAGLNTLSASLWSYRLTTLYTILAIPPTPPGANAFGTIKTYDATARSSAKNIKRP